MIQRRFWASVWLLCFLLAEGEPKAVEKDGSCLSLTSSENEFVKKISSRLDTYLERNLESGYTKLMKVLSSYGVDKEFSGKGDPDGPLESVLLQHQILLHHDMMQMFRELKTFLTHGPYPDPKDNEVLPKSESKNLKTFNFNGRYSFGLSGKAKSYAPTDSFFRPSDCSEVLVAGNIESGVYEIYPYKCRCSRPVKVYCDMETDGGGWTVFLSRQNVSKPINFTRTWNHYKKGFGTPGEEHWMGNEHLHVLTSTRNYMLRLEVKDEIGREIWGEWNVFKVASEEQKYKLSATTFNAKSTAYDRFSYVNNNYFSTFDMDNDKHAKVNCAQSYHGGWWYNACHNNNPTGLHGRKDAEGIRINPWSKIDKTIRYASWLQVKIRPHICSESISVAKLNTHDCNFP